ncbi:MBOAT family O-acyltransferase [Flavobacterium sp.]
MIYLLLASMFFYLNISPIYLLLLLGVATTTFVFTTLMAKSNDDEKNRRYMIANIILILLPLLFFKYFQVINNSILEALIERGLHWPLPTFSYLLPVGISFYTFVAIGYTVDVYNEEVVVEKNFGILCLFISFFPLILSGPIERAKNMLPQFRNWNPISYQAINAGLRMMLWGYFMKLVVADRLGIYIDQVYNNYSSHSGSTLLFSSLLYPFQVYCDLGGYSLIAIGTAKILGIDVMQNFKRPFFATTMAEFWRRWHISLISWLTDYIYTPLSFYYRKYKVKGIIAALMLTFIISGIWHGASLTFLAWGILQGVFLSVEALTQKRRIVWEEKNNLSKNAFYLVSCMIMTYLLFSTSQIFGRAVNMEVAIEIFNKIIFHQGHIFLDITTLFFGLLGLSFVLWKDINEEFLNNRFSLYNNKNVVVRCISYLTILVFIIIFGVFSGASFIYFQF